MAPRKPFLLRIDPALWVELEAWAQAELRSVNGQIEWVLRQALQKRKSAAPRPPPPNANSSGAPEQGPTGMAG
ncbi:MAG: hypothetical protein NT154_00615 [Verrucomicrobia bacterium]|nr:hypothetical protein [Verrucomicrobiota bacterium]